MRRLTKLAKIIVVIAALSLVCVCLGCAGGGSYSLNRDKSITAEWGTVMEYKVDREWEEQTFSSSDNHALVSYSDSDNDSHILIVMSNTKDSSYKYSVNSTYGDWIDSTEEFFTQSAEDQAAEYRELSKGASSRGDEKASADFYPDFKDFSLSETKGFSIEGVDFRTYKISFTVSYTDAAYEKAIEKNPNLKQTSREEHYYAIVKDGVHDVEVSASSEALLRDFMKTLKIRW